MTLKRRIKRGKKRKSRIKGEEKRAGERNALKVSRRDREIEKKKKRNMKEKESLSASQKGQKGVI